MRAIAVFFGTLAAILLYVGIHTLELWQLALSMIFAVVALIALLFIGGKE